RDTIIGSAGDDRIDGGSWGDQTLSGGEGNDVLHGGTGTDRLSGGGGGDTFQVTGNVGSGFEGYDRYDGGAGTDRIVAYGAKVDIGLAAFAPANGVEIVDASGASGAVRLFGDWNDNLLDFSATSFVGKLSIDGGGGRDTIIGTAAGDVIFGGHGADVVDGRGGNDTITGGSGADTFVFGSAWGRDVVNDFQDGLDRLDFRGTVPGGFKSLKIVATDHGASISWAGNEVLLVGVKAADVGAADFIF
ncbi:calcium-binding protein, partial [Accumulibacter sp.]|uniref:calcium-binding protein n=1 Tax=Accumulibacter sp. TaxID=2053492 RepID=UPI00257F4DF8